MKKLFLITLSFLLLVINQHITPATCIHAHPSIKNNTTLTQPNLKRNRRSRRQLNTSNKNNNIKCVDIADFFYEIILGLSTFPTHGPCTDQQEAEIAAFMQARVNAELASLPGTLKTDNKICSQPINSHRRQLVHERSLLKAFRKGSFLRRQKSTGQEENDERRILFRRRLLRSFIYVGGGRCRYCFYDNLDQRALAPSLPVVQSRPHQHDEEQNPLPEQQQQKQQNNRDLLWLLTAKIGTYPNISDISLCHDLAVGQIPLHEKFVKWINFRNTPFLDKSSNTKVTELVGSYVPGETFGLQLDMYDTIKWRKELLSSLHHWRSTENPNIEYIKNPVKYGEISGWLWVFDLPPDATTGVFPDDPLYLFLNGIKLDFKLLMSEPNVDSYDDALTEGKRGESFAGIRWHIQRWKDHDRDYAFGPEPDRMYLLSVRAPLAVFAHKNQVDVDFIIKPNAKAKRYAIGGWNVNLWGAKCRVTGLENSPFEDFKSAVESKLFHKLGMDLALEFQDKQDHCLYNKIPVVNVHLVEKENWQQTNPQCS